MRDALEDECLSKPKDGIVLRPTTESGPGKWKATNALFNFCLHSALGFCEFIPYFADRVLLLSNVSPLHMNLQVPTKLFQDADMHSHIQSCKVGFVCLVCSVTCENAILYRRLCFVCFPYMALYRAQ